jgi:hypothetical protein
VLDCTERGDLQAGVFHQPHLGVDHAVQRAGPRSGLLTGNKSGARRHRTWAPGLFRGGHGGSPGARQAAAGGPRLQRLRAAMSASQPVIKAICSPPKRHIIAMETTTGTRPMVELPREPKADAAAGGRAASRA